VGAPWIDGMRLADELHAMRFPGCRARALTFSPTFHKHAGKVCGGVQIHVTDEATFRPYATYVALLALAQRQAPASFAFRTEKYEFRDDVPAIDLLTGDADVRERILRGERPERIVAAAAEVDSADRATVAEAIEAGRIRNV
jgi:uncharacterized protein YbbC (DUF1343 family)